MESGGEKKNRDLLTMAVTIIINLIIVAVIAVLEFGTDIRSAESVSLEDIRLRWLFVGIGAFVLALALEYSKYRRMIMALEGRDDKRGALEVAILGKYYDNITPLGAGGQPFQILYLKKRGMTPGTAAAPVNTS